MGKPHSKSSREKKKSNLTFSPAHVEFFQNVAAENEGRLSDYYVPNRFFEMAKNPDSKKSFFIGRTGIGKTAILQLIRSQYDKNRTLFIDPEDFAFTIMEKSELLKELSNQGVNLDLFYKTMWKYIFITEILKKRFGADRKNWLRQKIDAAFDKSASRAYRFLLENAELGEGKTFSEQIVAIIRRMEHSVNAAFDAGGIKLEYGGKLNADQKKVVQGALATFEFNELNYFLRILDEEVLQNQN